MWVAAAVVVALSMGSGGCGAAVVDADAEALARASLSTLDGEIEIAGLERPVEVLRDRWGVAHVYAESEHDLFLAQGFVAAQDRLWQMEWWRRFGEGRLAEILGPDALPHDRFARLLRYRGDMSAEWTSYHPRGERIVAAFVEGVNAYIETADPPPVEFVVTGIEPEPWTPEVPILRMAGLAMTGNNLEELELARLVARVGVEQANRRDDPEPWRQLRVPEGLDPSIVPDSFRERVLGPRLPGPEVLRRFRDLLGVGARPTAAAAAPGSNNWVVAGAHTATGLPLLANDPHRAITVPSLRYLVHLVGPGWNVIGSGEPALPGVAIGHNERLGWGLTIVGIDQGDIFVERLHPDDPGRYRYGDGWEAFETEVESFGVKGGEPRDMELEFSRHGPILYKDLERGVAYAFRTVLSEPGTAGYLGSLRLDQAADADDFFAAMEAWKVPSENMMFASVDGDIGWQAAGLTPIRDGWDGRLPVPGTGEFEWRGFRPVAQLPRQLNPDRGFIVTANHNVMPEGYEPPLGFSWAPPDRYERIVEVLSQDIAAGHRLEIADFRRLQYDVYSRRAAEASAELVELARAALAERGGGVSGADAGGPDANDATEALRLAAGLLGEWDARLEADSAAAALYAAWREAREQQRQAGEDTDVPAAATASETAGAADPTAGERAGRAGRFGRDPRLVAVVDAVERLQQDQGADPAAWRYGPMNLMRFEHPFLDAYDLPPAERGGDGTTVNVAGSWGGASFREILDVADWNRSIATSTPGQSGQPGSPHYGDLRAMWRDGEYFPLAYSRAAVERATAHRLVLRPPAGDETHDGTEEAKDVDRTGDGTVP